LRLEFSEKLVMDNPEQAAEVLKVLRASGAELTLDEFGTGYSSLAYLNRFPFDSIKVCRELVRTSGTAAGAAIMRSMVALAHELSRTVVAEGVERADEATFLRSIGCEYAQGYHFGEPIPERAVAQLLKMVRRSERKMQPRGFFRPKFRNAAKRVAVKTSRTVTGSAKPAVSDQKAASVLQPASGKAAALPAGSVVRQRHKAADGKNAANQAPKLPITSGVPSPKPADALRDAVTNGASAAPSAVPAPPPALLQNVDLKSVPPSHPPLRSPVNGNGHAVTQTRSKAVTERPPNPDIMAPLSEALARVSKTDPTTGRPAAAPSATVQRKEAPPPLTSETPRPASLNGNHTVASSGELQPDFSTLPPSIAASLARLAGNGPPPKTQGVAGDVPKKEPKIASKG
jgi:hypothetical protein